MSIDKAIKSIRNFKGNSLKEGIATLETNIVGLDSEKTYSFCSENMINKDLLNSALLIKKVSSQIDVVIHSSGIINSLPNILEKDEFVESVSLGAGNTGKKFDLETNFRVAEFKFIDWKGGSESVRQNGIFKDFYDLAEYETTKRKVLYVVGKKYPLKFFNGTRAITSVLAKQPIMLKAIQTKYGEQVKFVRDYFKLHETNVSICDIEKFMSRGV